MEDYQNLSKDALIHQIEQLEKENLKFKSLNSIVSSIDALIWKTELASDGTLVNSYASTPVNEFLGLDAESVENTFDIFFGFIHPEDRKGTIKSLFSNLKSVTPNFFEYRMLLPNGQVKWVRSIGNVKINEDGRPEATGVTLDITERKLGEQALAETRQNYMDLFQHSPYPIIIHENGFFSAFNKAALDFIQVDTEDDLIGKPVLDYVHPDFREAAKDRIKKTMEGTPELKQTEEIYIRQNGECVWVETFPSPVIFKGKPATQVVFRDISERKSTFEKLEEKEARFRAFTEGIRSAVYTFDSQGCFDYVNEAMTEITGYSAEELKSMPMADLVHPDFKELVAKRTEARLRGEKATPVYDIQIARKNGDTRWVQLSSNKLDLASETIVLGSAIDIHGRKLAEEKLRESETQFRNLFEKSSDAMLLIRNGSFFSCNRAAMNMLKTDQTDWIFKTPENLSPKYQPDGQLSSSKAAHLIESTLQTGFTRFDWVHRDSEGHDFWCDISLTLMPADNEQVIHTIWRDISTRKQMEKQIIADKEQLAVTLRSIGDAVITTGMDGGIDIMNRVAENLTGWSETEARGHHVEEVFHIVNGTTGEKVQNPLEKVVFSGGIQNLASNTVLIARDGTNYPIDDSGAPILDKDSQTIGGILVFRDVTQSNKMQAEIMKLRKLDSISRLAGGIAHDFNNLLTGIIGNIHFASKLAVENKELLKYLTMAEKASHRAADLTNRLLTFSKGGEPIKQTASIPELVHESAEFILHGSRTKVEVNACKSLWNAELDKGQISQVIQNLILNSKQAMPHGGSIYIACENCDLNDKSIPLPMGKYVMITIQDEGVGINHTILDKIFDPFFTTKEEGSGLGLSVIHSIVQKHNGFIDVQSEQEKGTTFTIYLPASQSQVSREEKDDSLTTLSQEKHTILVMDDEELIRETVVGILTAYGYEVDAATTGTEAINMYRHKKYDLIILDLTIPGDIGGEETLQRILAFDPEVKAIVSSGFSSSPVMADYKKYGFAGVVSKPYRVAEMHAAITKVLNA